MQWSKDIGEMIKDGRTYFVLGEFDIPQVSVHTQDKYHQATPPA